MAALERRTVVLKECSAVTGGAPMAIDGGTAVLDDDFSSFVTARGPALVRAGVLLGCSYHDAEDLAQTALARCYTKWDRVCSASDIDAYVYRILLNTMHSNRRRRWRAERPYADLPDSPAAGTTDSLALALTVRAALGRLSPNQRVVLVLRFFVDLTEEQVSRILGVPPGTVKSRTSRALAALSSDPRISELASKRSAE
jgi:RNA polymerase sigma-70 factor (sigma-E family)